MILITGGSGSGKSAYAEKIAVEAAKEKQLYYLATMQVLGDEGKAKVERHKRLRQGKGFITRECQRDISHAADEIAGGVVLLECMSNLTANEMFWDGNMCSCSQVTKKICREIDCLSERAAELVIVTNNVFEDGIQYDEETMQYLKALGRINCFLAERAETVTEVVVGIPVMIKGGKK